MKMLVNYVRNRNGSPVGCIVAISPMQIGVSFCRKGDRFNKKLAVEIAKGRAELFSFNKVPNRKDVDPERFVDQYSIMVNRANRYFKQYHVNQ